MPCSARTESSADLCSDTFGFTQERSLACSSGECEARSCSHHRCWLPALNIHLVTPDRRPMVQHNVAPCKAKRWISSANIYMLFWKAAPFSCGRGWRARLIIILEPGSEEGEERWREGWCVCASNHFLDRWCNLDEWVYFPPLSWRPVSLL